jgi:hypothetical protein
MDAQRNFLILVYPGKGKRKVGKSGSREGNLENTCLISTICECDFAACLEDGNTHSWGSEQAPGVEDVATSVVVAQLTSAVRAE